jgi:sugar phosphate permease
VIAFQEDRTVAEEPVYSPDQLKPGNRKWARRGAIGTAVLVLLLFWGNHEGNTENIYLVVTALILVGAVVLDSVLRRNGLKSNDQ